MISHRRSGVLAAIWVAVAAGCYSPSIPDCSITCGPAGACPDGTQCGPDNRCHSGALDTCATDIDGPPVTADGRTGMPDARREPDARTVPDAPPPDAPNTCPAAAVGEPDDACPGELLAPVTVGTTATVSGRVLATPRDVDIFDVPIKLVPFSSCQPGQTVTYAVRISVASDEDSVRLSRFNPSDSLCTTSSQRVGRDFCIPFAALCPSATTEPRTFFFSVDQNGGQTTCTPYTVSVQACGAGSICDTCPPH